MGKLFLTCRKCHVKFAAKMQVTDQKGFQSLDVKEKVETCPYCGFKELYNKKDYIYVE